MKQIRLLSFVLALLCGSLLFVACTGDVPEPYGENVVTAETVVQTKIVVLEENENGETTENVLLEKDITVSSYTKPALSIKDLVNTLNEMNHIPAQMVYNRVTSFATYEANDTHMWFWSLDDKADVPIASAISMDKENPSKVVFTYAEKSASIGSGDGAVTAITVGVKIQAPDAVIYDGEVVIEGENSISVKNILKHLRDKEGVLDASIAGSIKSINDYAAGDGYIWNVYVDDELVKPSESLKDKDSVLLVYEAEV